MDNDWQPADLAEVKARLGEPRFVFATDPVIAWGGMVVSVVVWAFGFVIVPAIAARHPAWGFLVMSVGCALFGSFMLRWLIRRLRSKILVYPEGLVFALGGVPTAVRWDSITRVETREDGTMRVCHGDGQVVSYNWDLLRESRRLMKIIRASVASAAPVVAEPAPPGPAGNPGPSPDWNAEAFADDSRSALRAAEQWARDLHHDFVGTEHVLLALIEGDSGPVVDLCARLGVGAAALRFTVAGQMERGEWPDAPRPLPWTPMARRAVDHAVEEARRLRARAVTGTHMFLGLLRCEECVAAQALQGLNVGLDRARAVAAEASALAWEFRPPG